MSNSSLAKAIWINGSAGTGKSMLASFLVDHFQSQEIPCMYYFYRSGDRSQRSVSFFLRSLAFQVTLENPEYKRQLADLSDNGARLEKADPKYLWNKLFVSASTGLAATLPLTILIDGLDEASSPQTLLTILSSVPAVVPLRLILVSRSSPILSSTLDRFPDLMPVTHLPAESTKCDIPLLIEQELQSLRGSDFLRQKVMAEILDRASGNFLWVYLAIQEILNCHTQDEIELALENIPEGMHPLYERMEKAMAINLKPADQRLAQTLLAWVTCSQRPLSLEELAEAIEPQFPHVIDLVYTIGHACGNFMVVDRKSRVTLVHQTAREYLTKASSGVFAVAPSKAHEDICLRCMSSLCNPSLRSSFGKLDLPAFASYSAKSWQYHQRYQSAGSEQLLDTLMTFLSATPVLTWIQILASQDQLRVLVQSSRSLAAFVEKRRLIDSSVPPNLRPLQAMENIELWVTDLVKIVGKFGRNLAETPETIFKFIPQFCPRKSIINRQFGQRTTFSVTFSSDSNSTWDDSLAKLFVGATAQALAIVCVGRYFAILTSTSSILLWDCATCQKNNEIIHKEHVTAICASSNGKLLASYGFQNTKVWDVTNGKEIASIPNTHNSKALELMFSKDDAQLLAGFDDRIIRAVSLKNINIGWQETGPNLFKEDSTLAGAVLNSPCSMSFSADCNQVAVAYRSAPLSVWGLNDPEMKARCRRNRRDHRNVNARPWTSVDKVLWHPSLGEILGIYQDGTVFKWHPLEELSTDLPITANVLTCSSDGDLFATSDSDGTLKIWKYLDVVLIYQLRCQYPVADLAFSLDNRRIYDLRGPFCNIWEPNALIRLSDLDTLTSEARSESGATALSNTISEAEVDVIEPISALSVGPQGRFHCIGDTEGVVTLLDDGGVVVAELWRSRDFMPIEDLFWSSDGKHVILRDLGGRVIAKELETDCITPQASKASISTIFDKTVKADGEMVRQVLLNPNGDLILIAGATSAQVWSVGSGTCITTWKSKNINAPVRWLNRPRLPGKLLGIGAKMAFNCSWNDLIEESTFSLETSGTSKPSRSGNRLDKIRKPSLPHTTSSDSPSAVVENAFATQDGTHIMVEISHFSNGRSSGERQLLIFKDSDFDQESTLVTPYGIPPAVSETLQLPLGILVGERFVFIDNDHWLCSWRLRSGDGMAGIERHFFLPRDWLTADCLELCVLDENGVLLIPKGGGVAAIRSELSLQW